MSTAIEKKEQDKLIQKKTVYDMLKKAQSAMTAVIPKHLNAERLAMIAYTAIQRNEKLLLCTQDSLIGSIMTAAMLGLEPSGPIGHGALIPYYNSRLNKGKGGYECQFQPMYQGLLDLARRSGMIKDVQVRPVFMGDEYSYRYGLDPDLVHVPLVEEITIDNKTYRADDPSRPCIAVYCVVRFTSGGNQWDQMSYAAAIGHGKRYSPSWDQTLNNGAGAFKRGSVWADEPLAMCLKTILKKVLKYCPKSPELAAALQMDDMQDLGKVTSMKKGEAGVFDVDWSDGPPEDDRQNGNGNQATSALDKLVGDGKKEPEKAEPEAKKEPAPAAAKPAEPQAASKSDFDQIEILATECGVMPKAWKAHVMETMGFKNGWEFLTADRVEEVRKWITANAKKA